MNSKRLEALLEKYWSGKTSLEEEMELKRLQSSSLNKGDISNEYFKNEATIETAQSNID